MNINEFRMWCPSKNLMIGSTTLNELIKSKYFQKLFISTDVECLPYSGICDANNKKIFEGDIVTDFDGIVYLVLFGSYVIESEGKETMAYGWLVANIQDDDERYRLLDRNGLIVLGNKYENQALVKKLQDGEINVSG